MKNTSKSLLAYRHFCCRPAWMIMLALIRAVRFIAAVVESLDLVAARFDRVLPKATGRLGGDLRDLLKLYIYGDLNWVRSSRRLEAETRHNLEVIWLTRQMQPDFKSIADFCRENKTSLRKIFRAFVVMCRSLDLFGRELIAVDGTRLKAVNSGQRNFTKAKLAKAMAERVTSGLSCPSSSWMTRIRATQRPRRVWTIWKKRYPPSKNAAPALRHTAQSCKPAVRIRCH